MDVFLQLVLAVLPCALLMYLILYMDRHEREPMRLVIRIMAMGGIMVIPAAMIESAVGGLPFMKAVGLKNAFYEAFFSAAPIEELCKLIPVLLFAWNRPEFNEENDGIVYAGASALGFALVENVFFVLGEGLGVGVLRAVSSIPLHCFAGIVMGYYIGKARFASGNKLPLLLTGFGWAYFAHGLYDTLSLSGSYLVILLLPMIVVVFWVGFSVLKRGREVSLSHSAPGPALGSEVLTLKTSLPENTWDFPPTERVASHVWKAVVGRLLLIASLSFIGLVYLGAGVYEPDGEIVQALVGGIIIICIPATVGILLEISYRRGRRNLKSAPNEPN